MIREKGVGDVAAVIDIALGRFAHLVARLIRLRMSLRKLSKLTEKIQRGSESL